MKEADIISSNNLEYDVLLKQVGDTLERGRQKLVAAVGSVMVQTY